MHNKKKGLTKAPFFIDPLFLQKLVCSQHQEHEISFPTTHYILSLLPKETPVVL
jgi:hypothetical protein